MLTVSQTMANLLIMGKRHGKRVTLQTDKHRFLEMPRPKGRHLKMDPEAVLKLLIGSKAKAKKQELL